MIHFDIPPPQDEHPQLYAIDTLKQLQSELSKCDRRKVETISIVFADDFKEALSLDCIADFPNLKSVSLYGGKYSTINLSPLKRSSSLEDFILGDNSTIKEIDIEPLLEAHRIRSIGIGQRIANCLTSIKMGNIGECKSLRTLFLEGANYFPNLSLINKCKGLYSLSIQVNDDYIDLSPLAQLESLLILRITYHVNHYDVVHPIDGIPLLELRNLIHFECDVERPSLTQLMKERRRIKLPDFLSSICGQYWSRVNQAETVIEYEEFPKNDWSTTFDILEKFASSFNPAYWPSLITYILDLFDIENDRLPVDLAHCVIPLDLLRLFDHWKKKKPDSKRASSLLEKNIIDMVVKYLEKGNSTAGFDINKITSSNSELIQFVPRIMEMRNEEVRSLTFFKKPYSGGDVTKWQLDNAYYVHSLLDTVYGREILGKEGVTEFRRFDFFTPKRNIEEFQERLSTTVSKMKWSYIDAE